jgi:hypothetical protein
MNQPPLEVKQAALKLSTADAFISEIEVDMPSSRFNLWIINVIVLAMLAVEN